VGRGRLVAGRDPLGIRKLYTHRGGGCLWVASNLELLAAATRLPFELSSDALAAFLTSGGIFGPTGHTLQRGVERLRAGRVLLADRRTGEVRTVPGWRPSLTAPRRGRASEAQRREIDRELRRRLDLCVAAALRSSGAVAVELSGGLDSSTVLAVTHGLLRQGRVPAVDAFAVSYTASESTESDETRFQRAALARYPTEHHSFDIDELPGRLQVAPYREPAMVDTQGWLAEARERLLAVRPAPVCLTGQGGDAVFAMALPPMELAWYWRSLRWGAWARTLRAWAASGAYSVRELLWTFTRGDVVQAWGPKVTETPPWLKPAWASRAAAARIEMLTGAHGRIQGDFQAFHWKVLQDCGESLPDPATFSWELRCPLMARPMVELALSLPLEDRRTPTHNRVAQRRALAGVLPEEIRTRTTKGAFSVVLLSGLRKNRQQWEPLFSGTRLAERGIAEPARFREACLRLRAGVVDELDYLVAALLLEAWLGLDRPWPPRVATFEGDLGDGFAAWRAAPARQSAGL
jgi:asparagine synthase (glutamine-hydrolysing)